MPENLMAQALSHSFKAMLALFPKECEWIIGLAFRMSRTYLKIAGCCRSDINAE